MLVDVSSCVGHRSVPVSWTPPDRNLSWCTESGTGQKLCKKSCEGLPSLHLHVLDKLSLHAR